jgi:hypothetical protein
VSLSRPLDYPFRETVPQPEPSAYLYPVSLNGIGYLIDRKSGNFVRRQVALLKTQPAINAQQNLLLPPEVWRRSAESWHQGAGQVWADREDSLPYRFNDSMGVDVWHKWSMQLLPDTAQIQTVGASVPITGMVAFGSHFVVAVGSNLHWHPNLTGASVVTQTLAATVMSLTADGDGVIAALANGDITKCTNSTTATLLCTLPNVDFVHYVKDHLVAAARNFLYDVSGITGGVAVIGHTPDPLVYGPHPLPSFRWVDAAEGLSCIYLLGGVGDHWVVHRVMLREDAAALNPPIVAAMLQDGEIGTALGSYMGYLFVGSNHGMRFGVPDASGNVSLGPLIPTTQSVRCFEGQERYVWYGNTFPDPTHTGLGRVDLVTFTQPLAPAYANDLMAAGGGGSVSHVITFAEKRVFTVDGRGVFAEVDTLVDTGWLKEGNYSFAVVDKKVGLYAQLRFDEPLSGKILEELAFDTLDDWTQIALFEGGGPFKSSENITLQGVQFARIEPRFTLTPNDDNTVGPKVTRWEVRVVPVAGRASEWVIPLLLRDAITVLGGTQQRNVVEDRENLVNLVETTRVFTYREGFRSWQVNALDFEWRPEQLSDRVAGGWQGVFNIMIREIR